MLDYGIGNLRSAEKALQHVGAAARLVDDAASVAAADAVVLPGVGAFGACARALRDSGLEDAARAAVTDGVPFFGVCVGFQLLYEGSVESPGVAGLGIFPGTVAPLPAGVKHPQMQWNTLEVRGGGRAGAAPWAGRAAMGLFRALVRPAGRATRRWPSATTAARWRRWPTRGTLWGAQFHPEKSGTTGLALLANFVDTARAAA